MNIQNYNLRSSNVYNQSFCSVYTSATKVFSKEQSEIAQIIVKELRTLPGDGLYFEQIFERNGYDLVLEPIKEKSIGLFLCKQNQIEGKGLQNYKIYARHGSDFIKIGQYDASNINKISQNIEQKIELT